MSGYSEAFPHQREGSGRRQAMLEKPFATDDLLRCLRELIQRS
jgi:hypothetical protein